MVGQVQFCKWCSRCSQSIANTSTRYERNNSRDGLQQPSIQRELQQVSRCHCHCECPHVAVAMQKTVSGHLRVINRGKKVALQHYCRMNIQSWPRDPSSHSPCEWSPSATQPYLTLRVVGQFASLQAASPDSSQCTGRETGEAIAGLEAKKWEKHEISADC